ncbi:MAG: hypothetical protein ABI045_04780 [Flavobacteriales bacterium]
MSSIGEVMVLIEFLSNDKAKRRRSLGFLKEYFPQITSLFYLMNGKKHDLIYDC